MIGLVAAGLGIFAAKLSSPPAASASHAQGVGVKFRMQYQGKLEGTYSDVQPIATSTNIFRCPGHEETRSIRSSVRPGRKPYFLTVSKAFGDLEMEFSPNPHGSTQGLVDLVRVAQGFLMTYSGGQCVRRDTTPPGCGARTFTGQVSPLVPVGGSFEAGRWRVYLQWVLEPDTVGCVAATYVLGAFRNPFVETAARLDLQKLYRCGMRRPRACKLTIGGKKSNAIRREFTDANGPVTQITSARLEWKVTFVAVGKA